MPGKAGAVQGLALEGLSTVEEAEEVVDEGLDLIPAGLGGTHELSTIRRLSNKLELT